MTRPVRTRYAPSPTGFPHVGNIRAALFSWAFARANGGKFILRIEDTDQKRRVEGAEEAIADSLQWLGIDVDESPHQGGDFGPYRQSERLELYREAAAALREMGRAYYCFCTPERLEQLRERQQKAKLPPGYDGLCRDLDPAQANERAKTETCVTRFKMNKGGTTILEDTVRGSVKFENKLQDDFVILKADGFPTYHLAVVVDDTKMQISHVIRGDEWISSAPKHLQLYEALGIEPPVYAHLPLILGPSGKKLSKRDGDVAVLDYRDSGYLPAAMVNFLAFLGWSIDDKTSIVSQSELAAQFSLERVVSNPAVFDIDRLNHLNGHYIREMPLDQWRPIVEEQLEAGLDASISRPVDAAVVSAVTPLLHERVKTLDEIPGLVTFLFGDSAPAFDTDLLVAKGGDLQLAARVLDAAIEALGALGGASWTVENIEATIRGLQDALDLKLRKFIATLYTATMGSPQGIPLFDSLVILGRDRTLKRLADARDCI